MIGDPMPVRRYIRRMSWKIFSKKFRVPCCLRHTSGFGSVCWVRLWGTEHLREYPHRTTFSQQDSSQRVRVDKQAWLVDLLKVLWWLGSAEHQRSHQPYDPVEWSWVWNKVTLNVATATRMTFSFTALCATSIKLGMTSYFLPESQWPLIQRSRWRTY